MKALLLAVWIPAALSAQAAGGKAIFEGPGGCIRCHSIENRGGALGPDLSAIGLKRTPESLRLSLIDPNAEIYREYLTAVITTRQGEQLEGIVLNEDDVSLQLRDASGNLRPLLKENLKEFRREERSLMPSYASRLSAAEIASVVGYLRTLRGEAEGRAARTRKPGPLTTTTDWLTRANRDSQERPETLLDALAIPPGATVVDLGAGAGYFTWRLARRVGPRGKVIAVDVQKAMLDRLALELKKRDITNTALVLGTADDPRLPENGVDLVLMANAYHEFSEPEAMLAAVRRCLKPNGRVVVVEYSEENDDDPVAGLYTMTLPQLRSEIEAAGFGMERVLDFLPLQHGLIFTRSSPNRTKTGLK